MYSITSLLAIMDSPRIWRNAEEVALVQAWITTVEVDFPPGPPQVRAGSFWSRVCHLFHHLMNRTQYRRRRDVKAKFLDMKMKVKQFQRIYNELDNEHANTDEDILRQVALELYRFQYDGSEFTHLDAWNVLKNVPYF